jgi:hypothetical protein
LVAGGVTVALTGAVSVAAALAAPDGGSGGGGGGTAVTQAAGPPAPLDPLGADTTRRAEALAADAVEAGAGRPADPADPKRPDALEGVQPLLADDRIGKDAVSSGDGARRQDVFLYDYTKGEGVQAVVNTTTGRLESVVSRRGFQPPPSQEETEAAVSVLLADAQFGPPLRAQYRTATGRDLTGPGDVHSQALIFRAALATGVPGANRAAACGDHRCVQMFVRLPDDTWIDTTKVVVDLTDARVLRLA